MAEVAPSMHHEVAHGHENFEDEPHAETHHHDHHNDIAFSIEHDDPGHVCGAECNHTQVEADQVADSLFKETEAKQAYRSRHDHICDSHCEHTQEETSKVADNLFKTAEESGHAHEHAAQGEKGHVCTAECNHTPSEANQLADELFAKETHHGEKGHVCDASCQHSQEEASELAEELFTQKPEPVQHAEKVSTVSHETASQAKGSLGRDKQAGFSDQQQVQNQPSRTPPVETSSFDAAYEAATHVREPQPVKHKESAEAAVVPGEVAKRTMVKPEIAIFVERAIEILAIDTEPIEYIHETEAVGLLEADLFTESDTQVPILEDLFSESPASLDGEAGMLDTVELSQSFDGVEVPELASVDATAEEFPEDVSVFIDRSDATLQTLFSPADETELAALTFESDVEEVALPMGEAADAVIYTIPELKPTEALLPAIVENIVRQPESSQAEGARIVLSELLESFANPETRTEHKKELFTQLELLSEKLGIENSELLEILEIDPGARELDELSELQYEILHGLKKLISLEYSLEFTIIQARPNDDSISDSHDPRTFGQLVLKMLKVVKLTYPIPVAM